MAATVKCSKWGDRQPIPVGEISSGFVVKTTYAGSAGGLNDVLKICPIPAKGVTINDCFVQTGDADTNATPTMVFSLLVTDGTTTKTLIDTSTAGQAGGFVRPSKVGTTENGIGFTTDNHNYYIALKFTTASATIDTTAALNVGLFLTGHYPPGAVTE